MGSYNNLSIADDVSDPSVSPEVADYVAKIANDFNGLIVTSGTRTKEQQEKYVEKGIGVNNSKHLYGKAIDFRVTKDSIALTKLSKQELIKYGIEDVIAHDNHVHVEFI